MSDALKNYAKSSFFFEGENYIVKDKEGVPFELNKHVLEWDGNTVFEKCHPTFISKKRKVIKNKEFIQYKRLKPKNIGEIIKLSKYVSLKIQSLSV